MLPPDGKKLQQIYPNFIHYHYCPFSLPVPAAAAGLEPSTLAG
jgi:hypothetical protein